jgi:hypothetical protein
VLSLVACGSGGASPDATVADAAPREVFDDTKMLLANALAEGTFHGGAGDRARIVLMAPTAKLDWNLHGHAGGSTQTVHEELAVMAADYTFAPDATADWNLLLRNKDNAPMSVQVRIELYGAITWSGWD